MVDYTAFVDLVDDNQPQSAELTSTIMALASSASAAYGKTREKLHLKICRLFYDIDMKIYISCDHNIVALW